MIRGKLISLFLVLTLLTLLAPVFLVSCGESEKELSEILNVYNWEDYFAPGVIEGFEEQFGVKINLTTFDSEDALFSAIDSDPAGYDVIVCSDEMITAMAAAHLLALLEKENIPNIRNLAPEFRDPPWDPGNRYSVAYLWGTTGIAVNTGYVSQDIDSWQELWAPEYSGKIAMLEDSSETIAAALKCKGYSINLENAAELEEARQLLLQQQPLLYDYLDPMDMIEALKEGDVWLGHCYSGDAYFAAEDNPDIAYVIPQEGCSAWVDNFAIPADAPHKYTAEVFLNYMLGAEVGAACANYNYFASANRAAEQHIDSEILSDPNIYPPDSVMERLEFWQEVTEAMSAHNSIWAELQRNK